MNGPDVMKPMPNVVGNTSTRSGSPSGVTVALADWTVAGSSSRTPSTSSTQAE